MSKNNKIYIFICATPYHIMLANAICSSLYKGNKTKNISSKNHIIFTNHASQADVKKMLLPGLWDKKLTITISRVRHKLSKNARKLDKWCHINLPRENNTHVNIFLANDMDWHHQYILTFYKSPSIHLFEDGIGSYVSNKKCDPVWIQVARKIAYGLVLKKRYINCKGLGKIPAENYYSINSRAFYEVEEIEKKLRLIKFSSEYSRHLKLGISSLLLKNHEKSLIVTQPMAEYGYMKLEQELDAYVALGKFLQQYNGEILVKPHPSEKKELHNVRCEAIQDGLGENVKHLHDINPLEMYFVSGVRFHCISGIFSTALASAKYFNAAEVVISSFNYLPYKVQKKYDQYRQSLIIADCEFIPFLLLGKD